MNEQKQKTIKRVTRHRRIRAKISGTTQVPRLSVYRSNKFLYAQLIDDSVGKTLATASGKDAKSVGKIVADMAKAKKISKMVYDRGGFIYTGKVRSLAEAIREQGIKF